MTIEPILKAKLEKYQEDYLLNNLNEDELFERYVNQCHLVSIAYLKWLDFQ